MARILINPDREIGQKLFQTRRSLGGVEQPILTAGQEENRHGQATELSIREEGRRAGAVVEVLAREREKLVQLGRHFQIGKEILLHQAATAGPEQRVADHARDEAQSRLADARRHDQDRMADPFRMGACIVDDGPAA